jgi:hypothetical protein
MGELDKADRQLYFALRRVLLQVVDMIEKRLDLQPSTSDIRDRYRREAKQIKVNTVQ